MTSDKHPVQIPQKAPVKYRLFPVYALMGLALIVLAGTKLDPQTGTTLEILFMPTGIAGWLLLSLGIWGAIECHQHNVTSRYEESETTGGEPDDQ